MNKQSISRNAYMLTGSLARNGYDWWWHSFTAYNHETGEEKPFYIEFFVINPELSPKKVIYGQVPGRTGNIRPSYVMINVGTWGRDKRQLHRFFRTGDLEADPSRLRVRAGDCVLTETHTAGRVAVSEDDSLQHPEYLSDAGSMEWDLRIHKKVAFHVGYGASKVFRKLNAFDMFWHVQGMKTEYEGSILLDGVKYDVIPDRSYGYADKNWGKDFTSPWVWISSCHMKSLLTGKKLDNSVFDIGGGRPVVFGLPLNRKLLSNLWYEGRDIEFNFSKFWTLTQTVFDFVEKEDVVVWRVITQNTGYILDLECRCRKADMLKIRYESPDGQMRHKNLFNGGNGYGVFRLYEKCSGCLKLVDKVAFKNVGCEFGVYEDE